MTDDEKEDWWRVERGRTLGPRVELVEEFWRASGKRVHFYTPDRFLHYAGERALTSVSASAVGEAKSVSGIARTDEVFSELVDFRAGMMDERDRLLERIREVSAVEGKFDAFADVQLRRMHAERDRLEHEEHWLLRLVETTEPGQDRERLLVDLDAARARRRNHERVIAEHGHAGPEWRSEPRQRGRLKAVLAELDARIAAVDEDLYALRAAAEVVPD